MIIKTEKSTYYITEILEETEDLLVFRGFKNIHSLKKMLVRKVKLKKQFIISRIDLNKTIIFIKNKDNEVFRLRDNRQLVTLNKNSMEYFPCNFLELNKLYNEMTKKMITLN